MASLPSPWSEFVTPKNIYNTSKMFFGRYFFRAQISVRGFKTRRYILNKKLSTFCNFATAKKKLAREEERATRYAWASQEPISEFLDVEPALVYELNEILLTFGKEIKFKLEGSRLTLYTETEKDLLTILRHSKTIKSKVMNIHRPANENALLQFDKNIIFVPVVKFKYKIIIKDKKYDLSTRTALSNLFNNYPDEVIHMNDSLRHRLKHPAYDYTSGTFYVNDDSLLTFIQLAAPGMIGKIYRLEQTPE